MMAMTPKKIFIHNMGCERRGLDAQRTYCYFKSNGYEIVYDPKKADYIIFFTCAFVDSVAESCFSVIKKFSTYSAELIVAGCLPEIEKEKISKYFNGKQIATKDISEIDKFFKKNNIPFTSIEDQNFIYCNKNIREINSLFYTIFGGSQFFDKINKKVRLNLLKYIFGEYSLAYIYSNEHQYHLRIGWGCTDNCSYCAIKKAIGSLRSKPIDICLKEFKKGLNEGIKKFVLAGDDVGAYGIDIGTSFPSFLNKITNIEGDYEIFIHDFNPKWLVKYDSKLINIFKKGKISIIEIPMQSASPRILKLMNRFHNINDISRLISRLKETVPETKIFTDYIIGFPSETWDEMEQTLNFIVENNFSSGFVMPFSQRSGTKSEEIEPKISQIEKQERINYSKDFFKKHGYKVYSPHPYFYIFDKKSA
jgi:tRNA A37 methylthiotransferase MiaB